MFEINKNKENERFLLAANLPGGLLWEGKFDESTNFGRLIKALAVEYYRLSLKAQELSDEMDIRQTTALIDEWERSVGIPNSYFSNTASLERRRAQVEQLFSNFGGVQTGDDLVRVAAFFGYNVKVYAGREYA